MYRRAWAGCLGALLLVGGPAGCAGDRATPEIVRGPEAERVDTFLSRLVPYGFWGGVLLSVNGEIVLHQGYGWADSARRVPNTPDTVFDIGSNSKQFTASGILVLAQEGRLSLDDPIGTYLDGVPQDKQAITLHQLLTHTSGLVSGTETYVSDSSRAGVLAATLNEPLQHPPGEQLSYSNLGYAVLAAIIEKQSGKPFETFLRDTILRPAGLEHTGFRQPDWSGATVAHWYGNGQDNGSPLDRPFPDWNYMGSGGLLSTSADLFRWHETLLGERILDKDSKTRMFTPWKEGYGYGWEVEDTDRGRVTRHTGGHSDGMASDFRRYLDADITLILYCNRDGETMLFGNGIADKVAALAFGEEVPLPPPLRVVGDMDLAPLAGSYRSPAGDRLVIEVQDQALRIHGEGQTLVDALLDLGAPEGYIAANRRAETALGAMARGDTAAFRTVLADPGATNRIPRWIRERLDDEERTLGAFAGFSVLGTTPDWVSNFGTMMTFVRAEYRDGTRLFRLHWTEKGVAALGGSGVPGPVSMTFVPEENLRFSGYHLATGATSRLRAQEIPGGGYRFYVEAGSGEIALDRE